MQILAYEVCVLGKSLHFADPQSLDFNTEMTNSTNFTSFLVLYEGADVKHHLAVSFFNTCIHSTYCLFISVPGPVLKAGDPVVNKTAMGPAPTELMV